MASISLPSNLVSGNPARATEVMANFQAIVDQFNGNIDTINIKNGAVTSEKLSGLIAANKIGTGVVSNEEFNFLNDVVAPIQGQLNDRPRLAVVQNLIPKIINFRSGNPHHIRAIPASWSVIRLATGNYEIKTTLPGANFTSLNVVVGCEDKLGGFFGNVFIYGMSDAAGADMSFKLLIRNDSGTLVDGPVVHLLVQPYNG